MTVSVLPLVPADENLLRCSVPCRAACPADTDIPAYLEAIAQGDFDRAYRVNLEANVFPAVLGYVCTRPCEAACRHGREGLGESVAICFSKRSAAHFRDGAEPVVLAPIFEHSGKRVAVVGTGVSGLAAARELARYGHAVTVFERHARPGGLLLRGIPHFRLPKHVVDIEIEQIRRQGVEFRCNTHIGKDIELLDLIEQYDHIVIAVGAQKPNLVQIPGYTLRGVTHGLHFLLEANEAGSLDIGRRVVVLGAGFTAVDCARTARRLGASKVGVYYRRTEKEMYIAEQELRDLQAEGIDLQTLVAPVEILGREGRVCGVRFCRTELTAPDATGRRGVREVEGSTFDVACDSVILGTGQSHDTTWTGAVIQKLLRYGGLREGTHATAVPCVTQTGDFATGPRTLVDAIAHGKRCAREVDRLLMGRDRLAPVLVSQVVESTGRSAALNALARHPMPLREADERTLMESDEVGYDRATAMAEASRCYRCQYVFEIDVQKCIFCHACLDAKPLAKCIVKISTLTRDAEGVVQGYVEAVEGGPAYRELYIDPGECIRCNACRAVCPVNCIDIRRLERRDVPVPG